MARASSQAKGITQGIAMAAPAAAPAPRVAPPPLGAGGRPVRPGTLSACMIVRDEESMLPECLESLRGVADEVVLIDTGSRDPTPEIARAYGARVSSHPWSGDFAEARNASLVAADGEWLLIIDADERLRRADGRPVRRDDLLATLRQGGMDVYDVRKVNYADPEGRSVADVGLERRVVRNHPRLRYVGRVHEQLAGPEGYRVGRLPGEYEWHHLGYAHQIWESRGKRQRNLDLLRRLVEEQPEAPHVRFFLGRELLHAGETDPALHEFQRAMGLLRNQRPPYWFDLVLYWVTGLRTTGRTAPAIAQCDAILREFPAFSEIWLVRGRCLMAQGRAREAEDALLRCLAVHGSDPRVLTDIPRTPAQAWMELGCCYEAQGEPAKGLAAFREALRAFPALPGAVQRAARLALAQGVPTEAFEEWVAESVSTDVPQVAEGLWSVLGQNACWERAIRWADVLAEVDPGPAAQERRGVTLMQARRWEEALQAFERSEAAAGETGLGVNAAWCRTILGLALGREEVAARALAALGEQDDARVAAARRLLSPPVPGHGGPWWTGAADLRRGLLLLADQLIQVGADSAASRLLVAALAPPLLPSETGRGLCPADCGGPLGAPAAVDAPAEVETPPPPGATGVPPAGALEPPGPPSGAVRREGEG